MICSRTFIGLAVLIAGFNVHALRLQTRDCSFTWPAYEGDTCATMADAWSISEADFVSYNPGAHCAALEEGKDYCVEWSGTPPSGPSTSSPSPSPSPTSTSTPTPSTTRSTLITSTIQSRTVVITSASSKPTVGTCSSTPAGVVTPLPVQTGLVCGCTKFYKIASGDGCWAIANANSISLDDFYAWNPSTANGCTNLVPGNYVCIGKSGASTIKTSTQTTPKPTSSAPFTLVLCSWDPKVGQYVCPGVTSTTTQRPTSTTTVKNPAPGPTQTGIPGNCNKWVLQKDGVYCYDMAKAAGITLDRLYALNPALKGDCSGLWPGYAYCLGIS